MSTEGEVVHKDDSSDRKVSYLLHLGTMKDVAHT